MQGENSFDVLNLSTNHIVLEQHLMEPLIDLPLCIDTSISHMQQLVNKCDTFSLQPYICVQKNIFF